MSSTYHHIEQALAVLDASGDDRLERLFDLLKIPSISTDPEYGIDCEQAAKSLSDELGDLGFESRVVSTKGHPMVLAHKDSDIADAPHVLFYGHYDVQPVDPLELWETDPFAPILIKRDDGTKYIRARGASDDKGQLRTFIEACRAWIEATGRLPCGVTVFLEGEEESGSPSMAQFLSDYGDELNRADIALICDTGMWNRTTPAVTVSLRGMVAGDVAITGPDRDLHSGLYGGAAVNPLHVLSQILGDLWSEDGKVALEGFYDALEEPDEDIKAAWQTIGFDEAAFLGAVGLEHSSGERDRSILEKTWSRPTAEINGMSGGYTGAGFKTVIPSEASAKISFRLIPGQDPAAVWSSFEAFVRERLPAGAKVSFHHRGGEPGHAIPVDNEIVQSALQALRDEWQADPVLMGCGGSIPIVGDIKRHLGMDSILAGFALEDDAIHSPNEKYELTSFEKGTRSWVRILGALDTTF